VIPDVPFENPNVYQVTTSAAASITIPFPPFSISFNNSNISIYNLVAYETLSLSESPPGTLSLGSFELMDNQVKYYRNTTEVVTTGASYTPTLSGDYTAKLYNSASGCLSSAFSTTISLTVTSIFEAKGYQFSVFPNPVASSLTIRSEFTKALTYQLSNSKGELVTEQNFNGSTSIDVSHYTSGNYFLSIKDGSTISATYKILVE